MYFFYFYIYICIFVLLFVYLFHSFIVSVHQVKLNENEKCCLGNTLKYNKCLSIYLNDILFQ